MRFVFVVSECESYAVSLFSALLKREGHECHLVFDPRLFDSDEIEQPRLARFFSIRKQNIEKVRALHPDYIGFSVYTQDYQWAVEMARSLKGVAPIIFGGPHCILCADEVIKVPWIDLVCDGEGEQVILDLAAGKELSGIVHGPLANLDELPIPDKEIFYEQKPVFRAGYTISTGRGCPYHCSFCASCAIRYRYDRGALKGSVRQRSVDRVITELLYAKLRYDFKTVYFTDDNLTLNGEWLSEFSRDYRKWIKTPFYCTANPGTIQIKDIWYLKRAGCQMIGFGLQSTHEWTRKHILHRTGSNERILGIAKMCRDLGIRYSFDHILDVPGSEETLDGALDFYAEARPDIINVFTMTYLPKIELNKTLSPEERECVERGMVRTSMLRKDNDEWSSALAKIQWGVRLPGRIPFYGRLLLKDLKRFMIGRRSDATFPVRLLLSNMWDNLKIRGSHA